VTHAGGEVRGYCRDCIKDMREGGEHPVCRSAEQAHDMRYCAWCGHEVTA